MKSKKFAFSLTLVLTAVYCFFLSFYFVNPVLHYHHQQIAWQTEAWFLHKFLAYPGGLAEYFSLFISQFFVSTFFGSAIVALAGLLVSFLVYKTLLLILQKITRLFLFIPVLQLIVIVLMFDYSYHFSITVNLTFVSLFLFICAFLDKRFDLKVSVVIPIVGILLYYVSGGMYFLIFMASSLFLLHGKPLKKKLAGVFFILIATFFIPVAAYLYVFPVSLNSAFFKATPDVAAMIRYARPLIYHIGLAAIPSLILIVIVSDRIQVWIKKTQPVSKAKGATIFQSGKSNIQNSKTTILETVALIVVFIAFSGVMVKMFYNPQEKRKIEIDYYAAQQNWKKVITLSGEVKDYDRMVNFQFNRALLNQGLILEKLFEYEQKLGSQGLFLDKPFTSEVALPCSDLYFDLGDIDESLRYAFESETLMKNSPRVLKKLALNSIIMDKMEAAQIYLNLLSANPMENNWAKKYRNFTGSPELVNSDSLIVKKRNDMSKTEGLYGSPPLKLLSLLEKNPANKAAFECLIAFDLLEHDLLSLEEDFRFIHRFNYSKIPRVLEEAVILFRSQGKNNEFLNKIPISGETTARFIEFAKLTRANRGDREKAKLAASAFKNTYWYYVLFLSPKVTNLKLETQPVEANY